MCDANIYAAQNASDANRSDSHLRNHICFWKLKIWLVVKGGEVKSNLEKASLNNTWLVISELAAALLLWP